MEWNGIPWNVQWNGKRGSMDFPWNPFREIDRAYIDSTSRFQRL